MGKCYRHLSPKDRLVIFDLLFQGESIPEIAQIIGVHKSTLYRELARNSCEYGYRPDWASQQYWQRIHQRGTAKLDRNPHLRCLVIEYLKQGWSPEQIAGRLKNQYNHCVICHESIYRYIYSPKGQALKLFKYLRKQRRFRFPRIKRKRRNISNSKKNPIKQREAAINERQSFGHWEGDLLLFRHTKTNLLTLRERKSRLVIAIKNQSRKAKSTTNALLKYMRKNLHKTMKSLTLDNDPAFALHEQIAVQTNAAIYFCEPYKSYQKGGIENANKLIRTQLPRQAKIDQLAQQDIDKIMNNFNDRPMKCLGYQTPKEVFLQAFGLLPILTGGCT